MSSKEQLKDAIYQRNRTINELKIAVGNLNDALELAEKRLGTLKIAMDLLEATEKAMWWQFWK